MQTEWQRCIWCSTKPSIFWNHITYTDLLFRDCTKEMSWPLIYLLGYSCTTNILYLRLVVGATQRRKSLFSDVSTSPPCIVSQPSINVYARPNLEKAFCRSESGNPPTLFSSWHNYINIPQISYVQWNLKSPSLNPSGQLWSVKMQCTNDYHNLYLTL